MIGYGLLVIGALGLIGLVCLFLTARHNDKIDGDDFWQRIAQSATTHIITGNHDEYGWSGMEAIRETIKTLVTATGWDVDYVDSEPQNA